MAERVETGGPAFPVAWPAPNVPELGMSLRDYFAAQVLGGLATSAGFQGAPWAKLAKDAYEAADAMIAARSVSPVAEATKATPSAWVEYGGRMGGPINTRMHVGSRRPLDWTSAVPLFLTPPTCADADATGFARGVETAAKWHDEKATLFGSSSGFQDAINFHGIAAKHIRSLATPAPAARS